VRDVSTYLGVDLASSGSLPIVRCPRCQRDSKDGTVYCPGCGAPLALKPEPFTRPLDASVSLDRRGGPREAAVADLPGPELDRARPPPLSAPRASAAPPLPPPASLGPLPDLERSSWNLGTLAAAKEPTFAELPAPAPAAAASPPTFAPLRASSAAAVRAEHEPRVERASVRALAAAPTPVADSLPDVDVDAVEIHLRRPPTWRRGGAWAIDATPFVVLLAWALKTTFDGLAARTGPISDTWRYVELALADGRTITLPLVAGVGILAFVYQTLSHGLGGATLGKWILGLRVVGPDGRRPSLRRSAARAAFAAASLLLFGAGLLLALFTASGRGLHDLSAGTWVVEAP